MDDENTILQDGNQQPLELLRSKDVWFDDGNVVLVTEKTAFRVHTSILALNCEVFKDMASLPRPAKEEISEKYEDCPVVRLQDSPADMKYFLKTMYHFSYFQLGMRTKFEIIAGVLRLSTKYDAPQLRQRSISFLTSAYPMTLEQWDQRSSQSFIPSFDGELGAICALAVETDIRVILPAIFYTASSRPLQEVLLQFSSMQVSSGQREDIMMKFIIGRDKLYQAQMKHTLAFLDPSFSRPNCKNIKEDPNILLREAATAFRKIVDHPQSYQQWCLEDPSAVGKSLGLCQECCERVKNSIQEGTRKIWEELPGMFGVADTWETLKTRDVVGECVAG